MIYPLDYLCKEEINFNEITNFKTMYLLLESLKDDNFKNYIKDLNNKFNSFLVLDSNIIEEILCEENLFKNKKAEWFYENIFFVFYKNNKKIKFKKKIVYTLCNTCKVSKREDKIIKLNGLEVLQIKYINISSLIKLIEKYRSEEN